MAKKTLSLTGIAPFLALLAGILWGIIGIFTRRLNDAGFSSPQITMLRSMVTAVLLLVFLILRDPSLLKIRLRHIWYFIGTGICSITIFNICYFLAIELTTLSLAAILLYTAPGIVTLLSAFLFKEKLTLQKTFALILAFFGCALSTGVFSGNMLLSIPGLLAGLGSGIGYALYSIFDRVALQKYPTYTVTAWTFFMASLGSVVTTNPIDVFQQLSDAPFAIPDVLLMGLICTLTPYLLYTTALQNMDTGTASIMTFVEPMVGSLVGILYFREEYRTETGIGLSLMFVSLVLLNISLQKFPGTFRKILQHKK